MIQDQDDFLYLSDLRRDDRNKALLDFMTVLVNDPAKEVIVREYIRASDQLADAYYEIEQEDYRIWWRDYDGVGYAFEQVRYDAAISRRDQGILAAERNLAEAEEKLESIGIKHEQVEEWQFTTFFFDELLGNIRLEQHLIKQRLAKCVVGADSMYLTPAFSVMKEVVTDPEEKQKCRGMSR